MKKAGLTFAALLGACALTTGAADYEGRENYTQAIERAEHEVMFWGQIDQRAEVYHINTRFGLCGENATVILRPGGYTITCGEYEFIHEGIENACSYEKLTYRPLFQSIMDWNRSQLEYSWADYDCDNIPETESAGSARASNSREIPAYSNVFLEYMIHLIDMDKPKAEMLWKNYLERQVRTE